MSKQFMVQAETPEGNSIPGAKENKLFRQECLQRECALWIVEVKEGIPPWERCGVINDSTTVF